MPIVLIDHVDVHRAGIGVYKNIARFARECEEFNVSERKLGPMSS